MAPKVTSAALDGHRISLEDVRPEMAKVSLKKVEDRDFRAEIGRAIARAFSLANLSAKEAAGLMNRDAAQVSRWIAGTERPQLDALFAVEELREPLVVALSQMAGAIVRMRIEFDRREVA